VSDSPAWSSDRDGPFVPIPEEKKALYKVDFKKWFYADESARQKDISEIKKLTAQLEELKPEVSTNAAKLLAAVELKQQIGIIADRLNGYGVLRKALNTKDPEALQKADEGKRIQRASDVSTLFVVSTVQGLTEETLETFIKVAPALARYKYLFHTWRRGTPHAASEPVEKALSTLAPGLDPFHLSFYDLMIDRSPGAVLKAGPHSLNVTKFGDYAAILRLPDRALREDGFKKRMATYKAQSDLYAYALYQKAGTANALADIRSFPNAIDAELFEFFLSPKMVDSVLKAFRDHASLAIRFQKAEQAYQGKLLGLGAAEPWDIEARPANVGEPRFGIDEASAAVRQAANIFGDDYVMELNHVLDPNNGRMDMVAGPNRRPGDYTFGSYGQSWVLYTQGYSGYITDVVTLAHEATHVVHYRLVHKVRVPWYYSDGARYFTEGLSKVNELLLLDYLIKETKTNTDKLFYLRQFNSKLASVKFAAMYWAAYATSFEVEVYRRLKAGTLSKPEDIHEIWAEFGRLWSHEFDRFQDLKYTWADTHHFFDMPRQYSNYLFAWVFALAVYERIQADPAVARKIVDLMKAGFSDEPAVMLRTHLGIDLEQPETLKRMFAAVEKRIGEFEERVRDDRN
jgi:oligoendopeptidase F